MAYQVAQGAILEATVRGLLFEQTCMNVFHYRVKSISANNDGVTNMDAFNTAFIAGGGVYDSLIQCMSVSVTQLRVRLQWIAPTRYRAKEYTPGEDGGQDGVLCELPFASASVELAGEIADRHGVGRKSVFGLPTSAYNDGRPTPTYFTSLGTFATACAQPITTSTNAVLEPIIFNRDNIPDSRLIIQAGPKNEIRTQRTRVIGRGM